MATASLNSIPEGSKRLPEGSGSILLVEDEPIIRSDLAGELRTAGHRVIDVESGDEAVDALKSDKSIQIVVTDLRMPGTIDGVALANWISRERPDIKIVVVSAFYRAARQQVPGHLVLEKPVAPTVVSNAIDLMFAANKLFLPLR
jgi:CheY-like chemotaxis protein